MRSRMIPKCAPAPFRLVRRTTKSLGSVLDYELPTSEHSSRDNKAVEKLLEVVTSGVARLQLDWPREQETPFDDLIKTVISRFREVKKHEEAFVQFLPRRTQGEGLPATHPCPGTSKCEEQKQSVASRASLVKLVALISL